MQTRPTFWNCSGGLSALRLGFLCSAFGHRLKSVTQKKGNPSLRGGPYDLWQGFFQPVSLIFCFQHTDTG